MGKSETQRLGKARSTRWEKISFLPLLFNKPFSDLYPEVAQLVTNGAWRESQSSMDAPMIDPMPVDTFENLQCPDIIVHFRILLPVGASGRLRLPSPV